MADLDVIVLGAGPNGLCCAAYLARAGLKVAVVEKNVESGGGLLTQELAGFKLNHHATYMMLAERMPPYADLDLASYGVSFVRPPVQAAFLFDGGKSLILHSDLAASVRSAAALSPRDEKPFAKLLAEFDRMNEEFLIPATYLPPLEPIDQLGRLQNADALGERLAEISEQSPREVIEAYGLSDPRLKAALLYLTMMFGLDPEEGGMGFLVPLYVGRLTQSALVRGGSHQMASAMRRVVEEHGGRVTVAHEVTELIVEEGKVTGCKTRHGLELRARAVVSTLDPQQTFGSLLPGAEEEVPDLAQVAADWEWEHLSLFVLQLGVVGEAPGYPNHDPAAARALFTVMGYETPEDVLGHAEEVKAGKLGRACGHGSVLSVHDPLLVPDHVPLGPHHLLRFEAWAPYGVDWEKEKDGFAEACLATWRRYAPGIGSGNVRVRTAWSPRDIELQVKTMKRGSIKHGAYTALQMGYNRPSPETSSYRTPVPGLYVAGASVHPGGMVILGSGYNAARAVAEDLGAKVWWNEPESVAKARARGYLA